MKTSGNQILDKNLECIEKYNKPLAEKILNLPCLTNNIELVETQLKEPNLLYNGIALHSQDGAENEVKNAFEGIGNNKLSRHIVFGLGLGYLFKDVCEKSKGYVFLYEPNLEILRVTFELVDFSAELSKANVYIFNDLESFKPIYLSKCKYKIRNYFMALNSYRTSLYAEKLPEITKEIKYLIDSSDSYKALEKDTKRRYFKTVLKNIALTTQTIPLYELKNLCKDKTALVVSPGPTLDFNIETIKNNRQKFVIFCVGQAFKALVKNRIHPDFTVIIENLDCTGQVSGHDLSDYNFIISPFTNTETFKLQCKNKFLFPNKNEEAHIFWNKITNINIEPYIFCGTVSYAAIESAKMLGCKKIILVGQDLAYIDNKCYSDKSAYGGLTIERDAKDGGNIKVKIADEETFKQSCASSDKEDAIADLKVSNAKNKIYYVKGINGEMLPTIAGYAKFVELISNFAKENPDLDLINTSMLGAQIDGFKNMPLDETIKHLPNRETLNMPDIKFTFNKSRIIENLEVQMKLLSRIITKFEKANLELQSTNNTLADKGYSTEKINSVCTQIKSLFDIISEMPSAEDSLQALESNLLKLIPEEATDIKLKFIQNITPLYTKINEDISQALFNALSYNERIEIDYLLEIFENLSAKEITIMFAYLNEYFSNVEKECKDAIKTITDNIDTLKQT